MNLTTAFILLIALTAFILLKRAGQISTKKALAHLKNGALVIDVRTPSEFSSGHLPSAINLPLDQIETALPRRVKDKSQVILCTARAGCAAAWQKRS